MRYLIIFLLLFNTCFSYCQNENNIDDYAVKVYLPQIQFISDSIFTRTDIDSISYFMIGRWNSDFIHKEFKSNMIVMPSRHESENLCTQCLIKSFDISRHYMDYPNDKWRIFFNGLNYETTKRIRETEKIDLFTELNRSREEYINLDQIAGEICWYQSKNMTVKTTTDSTVNVTFDKKGIIKELPPEYKKIRYSISVESSEEFENSEQKRIDDYRISEYEVKINSKFNFGFIYLNFDFIDYPYKNPCRCEETTNIQSKIIIKPDEN
jgi:hypothetical protein